MAIELDCPGCFMTTRVTDAAMGTVIRCASCQKKFRIPKVVIPTAALADTVVAVPGSTIFAEPAPQPKLTPSSSEGPFFTDDEPEEEDDREPISPHAALKLRNQRRMTRGLVGVILAFAIAAIGIGATWVWQNRSNVKGSVDATVVVNATLSRELKAIDVDVSPADWGAIEVSLKQTPADLRSPEMNVRLDRSEGGVLISITPTPERKIVAIPTDGIPELQKAAPALHAAWKTEITRVLNLMSQTMQRATASGTVAKIGEFGAPVAVNGLAGGVGSHLWAIVDNRGYPCVFEDANHRLYFMVPPSTTSFVVQPREDAPGRSALPPKMRVTATVK